MFKYWWWKVDQVDFCRLHYSTHTQDKDYVEERSHNAQCWTTDDEMLMTQSKKAKTTSLLSLQSSILFTSSSL